MATAGCKESNIIFCFTIIYKGKTYYFICFMKRHEEGRQQDLLHILLIENNNTPILFLTMFFSKLGNFRSDVEAIPAKDFLLLYCCITSPLVVFFLYLFSIGYNLLFSLSKVFFFQKAQIVYCLSPFRLL